MKSAMNIVVPVAGIQSFKSEGSSERLPGIHVDDRIDGAVCFTFDDGPSVLTSMILDVLDSYKCNATFYVQGELTLVHEPVLHRMAQRHEIGSHFWSHRVLANLSDDEITGGLLATQRAIRPFLTDDRVQFRPPFGVPFYRRSDEDKAQRARIGRIIQETGHILAMWQIDTLDWKFSGRPEDVVITFKKNVADTSGGVVLMHDIHIQTVFALPGIIDVTRQRALGVAKVGDVLNSPGQL
jgi:peptidoglycan/xylan/chitin deacetylase (PgdA/CDA1 family)